jgi:hypothetical protein
MKQTIGIYEFRRTFRDIRPDNFSWEGQNLLFEYFENYEMDTGEEIEFDVISICCDYSEEDYETIAKSYDIDISEMDREEAINEVILTLETNCAYIGKTSTDQIVYRNY